MVFAGFTTTAMPSSAMAVPVSCAASSSFSSRDAMPIAKVPSIVPVMCRRWSQRSAGQCLRSGFTALYASISFSITGNRGGTANCDLAGGTVGSKGCCIVVNSDVLVIGYNSLTFLGEDEVDEILGYAGRLALGCNVERTGQLVSACLYVIYGNFCAVHLDSAA